MEFDEKQMETCMNIVDTKTVDPHDLTIIDQIVETVLQSLHKEAFGI